MIRKRRYNFLNRLRAWHVTWKRRCWTGEGSNRWLECGDTSYHFRVTFLKISSNKVKGLIVKQLVCRHCTHILSYGSNDARYRYFEMKLCMIGHQVLDCATSAHAFGAWFMDQFLKSIASVFQATVLAVNYRWQEILVNRCMEWYLEEKSRFLSHSIFLALFNCFSPFIAFPPLPLLFVLFS